MTSNRFNPKFTPDLTKPELIIGLIWLVVHMFVLPLLTSPLMTWIPTLTEIEVNAAYYGFSLAVVMAFGFKLLRREFDHFADRLGRCIRTLFMGYFIWYTLALVMSMIMTALNIEATPPNDQAVDVLADQGYNIMMVISVIAAPILEEVLFRGVLFQSIRKKSRLCAYIASLAVFGLYHTWQFAVIYQDPIYLLYSLQYIPITLAITWSYEHSGSLWTAIFFHASNNYLAMSLMQFT